MRLKSQPLATTPRSRGTIGALPRVMKEINSFGIVFMTLLAAVATCGCSGITSAPLKTTPVTQSCRQQQTPPPAHPGRKDASLVVAAGESMVCAVQVSTSALPDGAVGVNYKAVLAAANGVPPYTWSIVRGQLPPGLRLQPAGAQISGMPTQGGKFSFEAQVQDSIGDTASSAFDIDTGRFDGAAPAYSRGFTSTGLTLNGNAAINMTRLRLTDGETGEAGSAFFNSPVSVESFTNDFSFQLTKANADGFTFVIQGKSPTALGPNGGNLGYGRRIGKSVAVKFDLYNNAGEGVNSTGLYINGAPPIMPAVDMTSSGVDLHSEHVMKVHMTYDGAALTMEITDTATNATFIKSFEVDIPKIVRNNGAYVGFTGATGGLASVQDIVNWTYVPGTSSSQLVSPLPRITTSGLPGGAVGVNYNAALTATNGVPPYTWGITGGQLPPGLSLQASTGQISGTPRQAGTFSFQVQAEDSSGDTASNRFDINVGTSSSPVISRLSPNSSPTSGGRLVMISGSNFQAGAAVLFGGVAATSVTVSSATQIQAVTPAHIAGTVDVTIHNPDGQSSTLTGGFVYNSLFPTVATVSPNSGSTGGGTAVTISGTNFLAGALVLFGTVSAPTVTVNSATQILTVAPPNAAGVVDVTVENPGSLMAKLSGGFTYTSSQSGPPTISGFSPTSGPAGTQVTITGSNFESGATVAFGSTNAASTVFVGSTQLKATVPTITPGTYNLTVTNPDPASATSSGFTVTAAPPVQSLLNGCTVPNSSPSCPHGLPAGWTLIRAEGFESGKLQSGYAKQSTCGPLDSVVSSSSGGVVHSGNYSYVGLVCGDTSDPSWGTGVGTFNDIYVSSWTYLDPSAHIESGDFYFYHLIRYNSDGTFEEFVPYLQNFNVQPSNACCGEAGNQYPFANPPTAGADSQGTAPGDPEMGFNTYSSWQPNTGFWRQTELWVHLNTCNGSSANKDGFFRLFESGAVILQANNINIAGCHGKGNWNLEVGGNDTVIITVDSKGRCVGGDVSTVPPGGSKKRCTLFSQCPALEADGVTTCVKQNNFNKYTDDIIILEK